MSHVRSHLALCAPAYGTTARTLVRLCEAHNKTMDVVPHLTRMADSTSDLETAKDLKARLEFLVKTPSTKIIFWNPAIVDFNGEIEDGTNSVIASSKYSQRLNSSTPNLKIALTAADKLIGSIRNGIRGRKDIFLVGFKTTTMATPEDQYKAGLNLLKQSSCNLVLANDTVTRLNMIIVPEEASYHQTTDREEALQKLVEMTYLRSHLTFTRSTVVAGTPVPWDSELVPSALRTVVDYCIAQGAYKKFRGVTAGHFAVKINDTTFLTSRRKTDFNDMKHTGLVRVETDGPDSVIAYGSKPSVGGQSQRIVFSEHPEADCIVHAHVPIKEGSQVPVISQREYECGSHQCGQNTSKGLMKFGNLLAVYLDNHGPNIVFSSKIDPQEIIDFINANFDLQGKTGGLV